MTPAQIQALHIGSPVTLVRDDIAMRTRRYASRWRVSEITKEAIIVAPRWSMGGVTPRAFDRSTGLGRTAPLRGFWLEASDSLATMTEIQPKPYSTRWSIEQELRMFRRWPSWAPIYHLDVVSRWCSFFLDPIAESSPEMIAWMTGEKARLERAIEVNTRRIEAQDRRDQQGFL